MYVTPEYALQEATDYAFRLFERILYMACHGEEDPYYSEVLAAYEASENESLAQQGWLETSVK